MIFDDPSFGIVVELDGSGTIVRSLQDPDGSKYTSVSEVAEENGILFIASKKKNFIGIIDLKTLPKPRPIDQSTGKRAPPPSVLTMVMVMNERMNELMGG